MNKNIMISACLFDGIQELLFALEPFVPDELCADYFYIICDLNKKKHKMDLREAYSKIVAAKNTDERDWARIEYLRLRASAVDGAF
jgi:hypothetical protein